MSFKFTRTQKRGGIEALVKRAKTSGTVDVGIIDAGKHQDSEANIAQIGFWNEFGTITIPERSFMRATTKEKRKEIKALRNKLLKKVQAGEISTEQALGLLGDFVRDLIQQKIVSLKSPANADSTVAKKGSSNPLIDTGQLRNSITFEVNR